MTLRPILPMEIGYISISTDKAISQSIDIGPGVPSIVKGRLETRASHEIKDGKVVLILS